MLLSEIHMRDPFIMPSENKDVYYLYGSDGKTCWDSKPDSVDAYTSRDLVNWEGPIPIFTPKPDFWATTQFWAPEVHQYKGKYYLFMSFKAENVCRGTQILASSSPLGPFEPISEKPVTPADWECLDGTLYVDESGPWIVFCHEWVQVHDGEMCAMPLSDDLSKPAGDPILLFHASDAPWVTSIGSGTVPDYVTDGPFLYRAASNKSDKLIMLWSSVSANGYAVGIAVSESGKINGPWKQIEKPLYDSDGGHGMLFRDFSGKLWLPIHKPNGSPNERPVLIEIQEQSLNSILGI